MPRPESLHDVVELVRKSRVVEDGTLEGFLRLFHAADLGAIPPPGLFSLMVEQGLLTRFQAEELAAGRGDRLWIGGHLLLERIGRGGMGEVFLAEHVLLRRRVAVKVLTTGAESGPTARDRFRREAQAAAAVDHPNVVRVFDGNVAHDPPFLVMEFVDGVSFQAAVVRHGTFSAGEAAACGAQVARGLQAAAAVGLVHRDIKPANVLIDRKGLVKVLDLGIARFTRDPASMVADAAMILGTLDYLAPEQAVDSSGVDARADLFSLGATLYFLLAGHPPFPDDDFDRKLARKQAADAPPGHHIRPDVPPGLSAVIFRLLARKPDDRYPDAVAARAALEPFAEVGADFPARLFLPVECWGESAGAATDPGRDRDPTAMPPTRRITRQQLVRTPPAEPPEAVVEPPVPEPDDGGGPPTTRLLSARR